MADLALPTRAEMALSRVRHLIELLAAIGLNATHRAGTPDQGQVAGLGPRPSSGRSSALI